jgi:general secretion pathway protein E
LVLSTLHTNDAPTSETRLLDLGIPPFLIQATLRGILAQRLVRKICRHCKESFVIDTGDLADMGLHVGQSGSIEVFRGKGCQRCRGTGYRGRTGIHEVLPYSDAVKKLTIEQTNLEMLRAQAVKEGMVTLRDNAIRKFLSGVTTYQEVLRVTWEQT